MALSLRRRRYITKPGHLRFFQGGASFFQEIPDGAVSDSELFLILRLRVGGVSVCHIRKMMRIDLAAQLRTAARDQSLHGSRT